MNPFCQRPTPYHLSNRPKPRGARDWLTAGRNRRDAAGSSGVVGPLISTGQTQPRAIAASAPGDGTGSSVLVSGSLAGSRCVGSLLRFVLR
jgi:hypothetical protein